MSWSAIALLSAAACYLGFQWTVRSLVYPQFDAVARSQFAAYEVAHQRRISWTVGPLFAALVGAGAAVTLRPPAGASSWMPWAADALIALILLLTALGAVPLHRRLSEGFDVAAHRRLLTVDTLRLLAAGSTMAIALALVAQSTR